MPQLERLFTRSDEGHFAASPRYDFARHDFASIRTLQNHGGQNHEDEGIDLLRPTHDRDETRK